MKRELAILEDEGALRMRNPSQVFLIINGQGKNEGGTSAYK
jgi:hypothetical protein